MCLSQSTIQMTDLEDDTFIIKPVHIYKKTVILKLQCC